MTAPEVIETANFHVADYVIFGLTIAVSAGVGVYFGVTGGRQKTTTEYLVGNRRMKIAPVALSLVVSFESSILLLGFPAEMYGHGTQFWMCFIGQSLALLFAARVCVPLIHPLRVTSSYEYLELRYRSRRVRLIGSALGILYQTFYMGIVLFGPAIALEAVTGFPVWSSVILVAAASVFYTSLGGIKAVIWTDAIQCVIMTGGMLAITIMGCLYVGGFGEMWQLNVDGGRVKFLDFDPNPLVRHTFWTLVVGTTMRSIELGFNQTTVQRVVSMETPTKAQIVVLLAIPGFVGFGTLACLEGMMTYAYFRYTDCDPYGAKLISNTNQVAPYMVVEMFRNLPGLPGLFLASLFSASLSTLSSSLSSISAIIWTDFLRPHMPNASERKGTIFAKAAVVVFGGIAIGISFLIMLIGGPLQQIAIGIMGAVSGPLSGMFIAGCFCTITNSVGAITGGVVSLAISLWLTLGSSFSPYTVRTPYLPPAGINNCFVNGTFNSTLSSVILSNITTPLPEPLTSWETTFLTTFYSISYLYVAPIGVVTCALVSVLVSSLTGGCRTAEYVDPKYIAPVWDNLCCCLPESCRRKLRYKGHAIQRD